MCQIGLNGISSKLKSFYSDLTFERLICDCKSLSILDTGRFIFLVHKVGVVLRESQCSPVVRNSWSTKRHHTPLTGVRTITLTVVDMDW